MKKEQERQSKEVTLSKEVTTTTFKEKKGEVKESVIIDKFWS